MDWRSTAGAIASLGKIGPRFSGDFLGGSMPRYFSMYTTMDFPN